MGVGGPGQGVVEAEERVLRVMTAELPKKTADRRP
jgi:hypothetical protein